MNIVACTNPTIISKNMKGNGRIKAKSEDIVTSSASPANIFPKSRKDSESILVNSATISNSPTKRFTGLRLK